MSTTARSPFGSFMTVRAMREVALPQFFFVLNRRNSMRWPSILRYRPGRWVYLAGTSQAARRRFQTAVEPGNSLLTRRRPREECILERPGIRRGSAPAARPTDALQAAISARIA